MPEMLTTDRPDQSENSLACMGCHTKLPLREHLTGEPAIVWHCTTCNLPLVAIGNKDLLIRHGDLVLLDGRYFDTSQPDFNKKELLDLLEKTRSPQPSTASSQKRVTPRKQESRVVSAVELNEDFTPVGSPLEMVLADITRQGIGLLYHGRFQNPYLAIDLSAYSKSRLQVIASLVYQKEIDFDVFRIGGEFVTRLGTRT